MDLDEPHPTVELGPLLHQTIADDDTSAGSQFVEQARQWFDTLWSTISRDATP